MEQEKEKGELLSSIDKYRLLRENDLVFYVRTSMEEVQSTCQKLELSGKIRVLLRELPLTCEERHRLIKSIVVGGILLLLHLTKLR